MIEKLKKIWKKTVNRETVCYLIFGVLTTVVNWVVYTLFDNFIFTGNEATAASGSGVLDLFLSKGASGIIAWFFAVCFAYVTNRLFVFTVRAHGTKDILKECMRFMGGRVATGVIEILGTPALVAMGLTVKIFGLDIAKIIVSVIIVILNYIISKLFVFKENKDV